MKKRIRTAWPVALLVILALIYGALVFTEDPLADGIWFDLGKKESVESIHLKNMYGDFRFYREDGTWMVEGGGTYRTNELKMDLMCEALKGFRVNRVLEEEDPIYGLSADPIEVEFTTSKGEEYGLAIGRMTMSASDYYVKDLTDGRVFVTDGASVAQLTGSLAAYRYKEVFTIDKQHITGIRYFTGGNLSVQLEREEEGWFITAPYEKVPARAIEMDELLTQMRSWSVAGYVDPKAADPLQLGLTPEAPRLEVTDDQGSTQTLVFGASSGTNTCVQTGGEDEILLLYTADIDLSTLTPEQLLFVAPLKTSVNQISSIQVSVSTGDYIFTVDPDTGLVKCNGKYVEEDAFNSIFFRYISMIADGADQNRILPPQGAVAYFRTVFRDGSVTEMTAYGRDQGTCYMELDGQMIYYLDTAKIVDLVARIEAAV